MKAPYQPSELGVVMREGAVMIVRNADNAPLGRPYKNRAEALQDWARLTGAKVRKSAAQIKREAKAAAALERSRS